MALLYLDTSALVKLYVDEPGSERMIELASEDADYDLAICSITQVEFHAAIWKRRRTGESDEIAVRQAAESFEDEFRSAFLLCPIDDRTLDLASAIVPEHGLRAYDAVQLASCLALARTMREPLTFVCADRALLTAAEAEGLPVLDPSEAE